MDIFYGNVQVIEVRVQYGVLFFLFLDREEKHIILNPSLYCLEYVKQDVGNKRLHSERHRYHTYVRTRGTTAQLDALSHFFNARKLHKTKQQILQQQSVLSSLYSNIATTGRYKVIPATTNEQQQVFVLCREPYSLVWSLKQRCRYLRLEI